MDELEMLWKLKEDMEGVAKELSCECDLLWEGYDVYRFGFKCVKQRMGIQIQDKGEGCYAYLLNADKKELDELREVDAWRTAPYDETRKAGGKPFDIQLPITCRKEEFKRVLDYLIPKGAWK